jgi:hypothetical protein
VRVRTLAGCALLLGACSSSESTDPAVADAQADADAAPALPDGSRLPDTSTHDDAAVELTIGAAAVEQRPYAFGPPTGTLTTGATQTANGSVLLLSLARGNWAGAPDAPTDSPGNGYSLVGTTHDYGAWPGSATGTYVALGAMGDAQHTFSMSWGDAGGSGDEVTISAIEVRGATTLVDSSWVERSEANAITSDPVTTTGPAMLVAWWWGSGGVRPEGTSHVAIPGDGFKLAAEATALTSISSSGYVQVAVAYRNIETAGTYSVSWTTDNEGAQLHLVALQ